MNCCWVRVMVDMNSASLNVPIRNMNELASLQVRFMLQLPVILEVSVCRQSSVNTWLSSKGSLSFGTANPIGAIPLIFSLTNNTDGSSHPKKENGLPNFFRLRQEAHIPWISR